MGRFPRDTNWRRGVRGWGSAPFTQPPTGFQQNPQETESLADQGQDISEATGDMFFNWVYRRITDAVSNPTNGSPCTGPNETGAWQGFRNIKDDGSFDASLPGNARYWWMEQQIQSLFAQHPSWQ
jgi:hypothetical protein